MSLRFKPLALVSLLAIAVGVTARPALAEATSEWVAHMNALGATLGALLRDAAPAKSTSGAAANPDALEGERRVRLKRDTEALSVLVHRVSAMGARPDADPTIPWLLRELDITISDVSRARADRSQEAALAVAWTCMGCHTRADYGTPKPIHMLTPVDPSLPPDVRGVALAATRRFADARVAFRAAAFDEEFAKQEPLRWERAVKGTLLLDVRVLDDLPDARAVVDRVLNTPGGELLWEEADGWRRALAPLARAEGPRPTSVAGLQTEAQRLMDQAAALGPTDTGRAMLYLRATAVVHELLMRKPKSASGVSRAEAFAWLGVAYAGLRDLDIWSLHLVYDAACVEEAPHSELAAECFARWEDGARATLTGNGGGALPDDVAAHARRLRLLAAPR